MEVKATAPGYYDLKLRPEGSMFTIKSEKEFSENWMEKLDGKPSKPSKSGAKKVEDIHNKAMEDALDKTGADVI